MLASHASSCMMLGFISKQLEEAGFTLEKLRDEAKAKQLKEAQVHAT